MSLLQATLSAPGVFQLPTLSLPPPQLISCKLTHSGLAPHEPPAEYINAASPAAFLSLPKKLKNSLSSLSSIPLSMNRRVNAAIFPPGPTSCQPHQNRLLNFSYCLTWRFDLTSVCRLVSRHAPDLWHERLPSTRVVATVREYGMYGLRVGMASRQLHCIVGRRTRRYSGGMSSYCPYHSTTFAPQERSQASKSALVRLMVYIPWTHQTSWTLSTASACDIGSVTCGLPQSQVGTSRRVVALCAPWVSFPGRMKALGFAPRVCQALLTSLLVDGVPSLLGTLSALPMAAP